MDTLGASYLFSVTKFSKNSVISFFGILFVQVVAGLNYKIKVDLGQGQFAFVVVFKPLPRYKDGVMLPPELKFSTLELVEPDPSVRVNNDDDI